MTGEHKELVARFVVLKLVGLQVARAGGLDGSEAVYDEAADRELAFALAKAKEPHARLP